jgi:uncharacterized UPF0160 family protein
MDIVNGNKDAFHIFDRTVVEPIDAQDNGVIPERACPYLSLSTAIGFFNPNWDDLIGKSERDKKVAEDLAFIKAVDAASPILDKGLNRAISTAHAKAEVDEAISNSDGKIMILNRFAPWNEWLCGSNNAKAQSILYVIFPSDRGGFNIQCAPVAAGSFVTRKSFPEIWRGRTAEELAKLTGISELTFCHAGGFLCNATTLEAAIKVARMAIDA